MRNEATKNLLHRYWFRTRQHIGIGVTAYSLDDAKEMIRSEFEGRPFYKTIEVLEIIEDIDVRLLDSNHVLPNMGPPNFRGVWFPNLQFVKRRK